MATTMTYANALTTIKAFAIDNGFDNKEVIEKIDKLIAQKATKTNNGKKSRARVNNEQLANVLVKLMQDKGVNEIRAAWVRENLDGVSTSPKAVAVLNAATDLGLLHKHTVKKSETRNEFVFTLSE